MIRESNHCDASNLFVFDRSARGVKIRLLDTLLIQWYRALVARATCFEHRSLLRDRTDRLQNFQGLLSVASFFVSQFFETPRERWISVSGVLGASLEHPVINVSSVVDCRNGVYREESVSFREREKKEKENK